MEIRVRSMCGANSGSVSDASIRASTSYEDCQQFSSENAVCLQVSLTWTGPGKAFLGAFP